MSRRCGSLFNSSRTPVAVELGHQDVEQQHVEPPLPEQLERLAPVLGEDDRVPFLLEAAAEQESVHPVVVGDEDRARRDESAHVGAFGRTASSARSSEPRSSSIRARRPGASSRRPSFACCSRMRQTLGEVRRPERGAVRLQCVRRPPDLGGVSLLEGVAKRREERRHVGEERIDHLGDEVVAPELAQALQCGAVDLTVGNPRRRRGIRTGGRTRFSASASTSGRIGFAT